LKKQGGKWPDMWQELAEVPLSEWKAWDKWQRSFQILVDDHDGGGGGGYVPPPSSLVEAQGRIFLAQNPLEALEAPSWMVAVCTADEAYRHFYSTDTIRQLDQHFAGVESWCDCRVSSGYVPGEGTGYNVAVQMAHDLGLDGAWGQCETAGEFDNGYAAGSRRMVGNLSALRPDQLEKISSGEVVVSVELYRNCQPGQQPDWKGCNSGVGGNCIAVYADSTPCYYTPVETYKAEGLYVPHQDSVYGVGLTPEDWRALA
jgi:hypothetical protein